MYGRWWITDAELNALSDQADKLPGAEICVRVT